MCCFPTDCNNMVNDTRKRRLSTTAPPNKRVRVILSAFPARLMASDVLENKSPHDFVMEELKSQGVQAEVQPSKDLKDFFSEPTQEETNAYDHEVLNAIRSRDLDTLRKFHQDGRPLKCSNKFGESLLHLACRRGFFDVVLFLVKEAGVTVRVKDDYGRTPLHDACWTTEPNFELFAFLLKECSDLLLLSDARGFTPLAYARRDHWDEYVKFLKNHSDLIVPTKLAQ